MMFKSFTVAEWGFLGPAIILVVVLAAWTIWEWITLRRPPSRSPYGTLQAGLADTRCDTLEDIAAWEKEYPELEIFSVVLPEFLGRSHLFFSAMQNNLRNKGTVYVYYLCTELQIKHLLELAKRLQETIDVNIANQLWCARVADQFYVQLLHKTNFWLANPHLESRSEGYRVLFDDQNRVVGGVLLDNDNLRELKDTLEIAAPSLIKRIGNKTLPLPGVRVLSNDLFAITESAPAETSN